MVPTCFFSDIQEGKPWRRGWKGLWVSLAYTRAFGTLGLQFKSGQTHLPTLIHGNIDLSSAIVDVMANRWNVMQDKPKRKRRVTMDTYEFCTFLIFVSLGAIGVMILLKLPSGTFDHVSDSRNGVIGLGFVISGALLLKFDSNARARAAKKFDYDLAEYEMIRTKWLEMEATKLDMQKEHSIQYLAVDSSKPIIVESLPESKVIEVSPD